MGTKSTRTSPESGQKNAFGSGVGLAHEVGLALVKERITPVQIDRITKDPILRNRIGAILRGESVSNEISFDNLLEREIRWNKKIARLADMSCPDEEIIKKFLQKAEEKWAGVSVHDRFVLPGLNRQPLISCCQSAGLKIYQDNVNSADCEGEELPTEAGIIRLDFSEAMKPTDLAGHPFYLIMNEQQKWAQEQGGDGLYSVEETLYMFLRSILEFSRPLWGCGWARCRNSFGGDNSLHVFWHAADGLEVVYDNRDDQNWGEGALARKYLDLGD